VSDTDGFLKITDLVPYAWFDLIARMIPGSVAIFLFYRIRFQSAGPIEFLLVAILIYLVGFSLEKISALIHKLPCIQKFFPTDEDLDLTLWDAANIVHQNGSIKVGKMLAELQLFKSLSACFLIYSLIYGLSLIVPLESTPVKRLCVFSQLCGDLRRFDPSWAWVLIFLLIAFFMELFARDHYMETYKTVKRYLNHHQR
jgi:hypothetical protein